ncbi:hypothetical protein BBJ28_00012455 [Nothophytophthora sp. Chile5]|nr:hypothetical protein BBJ28_00012455 [Nothophytophthora sp. Chile5]
MDWDDTDGEVQQFSAPATKRSLPPEPRAIWASVVPTPKLAKVLQKKKVVPAPVESTTGVDSVKPAKIDGKQRQQGGAAGSAKLKVILGAGLCICLAWTLGLVVLTVTPNAAVNRLMNTENFDDGAFWLIVDTPLPLRWVAAFGLSIVGLGYAFVLFKLVAKRARLMQDPAASQQSIGTFASAKARIESAARDPQTSRITSSVAKLAVFVAQGDSPVRKRVVRRFTVTQRTFSWP